MKAHVFGYIVLLNVPECSPVCLQVVNLSIIILEASTYIIMESERLSHNLEYDAHSIPSLISFFSFPGVCKLASGIKSFYRSLPDPDHPMFSMA